MSASTQVAATGAGSPGNETTTFGPKTLAAVKIYQAANGLTPANQVGPKTRAILNAAIAGTSSTTTTTTTTTGGLPSGCTSAAGFSPVTGAPCSTGVVTGTAGTVSAMLASDTPASGAIVGGQAQADLLHINFTGTGTVTSITLQDPVSQMQAYSHQFICMMEIPALPADIPSTLMAQLTMNGISITVTGSHDISVRGDVAALVNGQSVTNSESSATVTLVGFTANGATASANVMGNSMAVVSGTLATVSLTNDPATPNPTGTTINAGSTNQTLWSQTVSVSPRSVLLNALTVKMIGSAPSNALANVGLYIDGTLAKTATINANLQFVFDASASPVTLSTGTHLMEVRGDIVAGSSRSFYLSLEQGSDISVKDSQLGVFVSTTHGGNAVYNVNGGNMLINGVNGGTIIISQDPAFANVTTLVGGATNVTMASFTVTTYGEDEKITALTFSPTITGTANTLTNVGLYVNGGQVGSNQTATNGLPLSFQNLGSQVYITAGTTATIQIKGDVIGTGGVTFTNGTANFNLASGSNNAQGISSSQLTSTNGQNGQFLAISNSNVSFAVTSGFATTFAAPNSTQTVHIGSFSLNTASAEGVNVNNIAVTLAGNAVPNYVSSLMVKANGTQVGTTIGAPVAGINNFAVNTSVGISSTTVFDVYINVLSAPNGDVITPSMLITYQGLTSRVTGYTNTGVTLAGPTTTIGVPTIAPDGVTTVAGSSLAQQYVSGNSSTALPIATFNVVTSGIGAGIAGAVIQDITFTTATPNTITSVTVNGKTAAMNGVSTTVYSAGITVPSDNSGVNIPVTVALACVGSNCAGESNSPVTLSISKLTYNNGTTVVCLGATCDAPTPAIAASSATLYLVGSVPTVTLTAGTSAGLQVGNQLLGTFTIGASANGDIKLNAIPVTLTISGGVDSITGVTLEDSSGNALTGISNQGFTGSDTFSFSTPRSISKNTSETYYVYGTVVASGGLGASGNSSVAFSLGAKGSFAFTDVSGGVFGVALPGTYIYGYPTGSQSKSN